MKLPFEVVGVVIGGLQALVKFSDLGVQRSCPLVSELDGVLNRIERYTVVIIYDGIIPLIRVTKLITAYARRPAG